MKDSWIKSAAVIATHNNTNAKFVGTGYCHQDCYDYIHNAYGIYAQTDKNYTAEEGFMLGNNTFISREDALELVHCTGQLKEEYKSTYRLCSYMLKYDR